jgi:hypothetical protein
MTQELRVLKVLQDARGAWINGGEVFRREMMLSQYHRAIHNLQNKRDRYHYEGTIEASDFTDEHRFKSYRLVAPINSAVVERINRTPAFDAKEKAGTQELFR